VCGIVGFIAKYKTSGFQYSHQKMFYQMLFADQLRGSDATGVITCHNTGDFGIMKEAVDAYNFNPQFIDSDLDKDLYKNGVAVIGHNRAKTVGDNKDENAHPFVVDGTFAMVHNGTLYNHKALEDTDVDSHALAITFKKAMDEGDYKTALEDALGKVFGAFACVWYDQKRHEICMIRNKDRPLNFVVCEAGVLFGSEPHLLTWIAARNNSKIESVTMCKEHTLYRFDMKKQGGVPDETFLSPKYRSSSTTGGYTNGVVGTATTGEKETTSAFDSIIEKLVHPPAPNDRKPVSKNSFKRIRAQIFKRQLNFWLDDFVEADVDNTGKATTALVMGSSIDGAFDLCEHHHFVRAVINLKTLGLKEDELYGNIQFSGTVDDVEYDKVNKAAIVRMCNVIVKEVSNGKVVH